MGDKRFTPRMQKFADEYVSGEHTGKQFNASAAAEYAGFANPPQYGSKLLRHPLVKEYIDKHLEAHSMSAAEVLARFTEIARAEIGDVVTKRVLLSNGTEVLDIDPDAVLRNKKFIKSFGLDTNGNPKIEFHDAHAALRDIARVLGMNKDSLGLHGPGGAPLQVMVQFVDPDGTSPDDLEDDIPEEMEDFSDLEEYDNG